MKLMRLGAEQIQDAGVSLEDGKPVAEPNAQASPTAKPTDKLTQQAAAGTEQADAFKPVKFDPTAQYYHPNKPDKVISGDELYTTYNRGLQFDKVQSDLHKTQSEVDKLAARNQELEKAVAQNENTQLFQELMKQQSQESRPSVTDQSSEPDSWLTGNEGEDNMQNAPQQLSPQMIQKIVNDAIANQFKQIRQENKQVMEQSLNSMSTAQQQQSAQERAFMTGNKVMETDLMTSYPRADKAEVDEIVRLENARNYSAIAAAEASNVGDMATMEEQLQSAATFSNKSRGLQLKLAQAHEQRQSESEARAQLDVLTAPIESGYSDERPEWEAEFTPIERKYKVEDVKAANEDIIKKAYQKADTTERILKNYPKLKRTAR